MRRMIVLMLFAVAGCGDDTSKTMLDMATASNPPPKLGAQIDRMGRPAINTALSNPFDTVAGSSTDAVKDAYNAESSPAMWQSKFRTNMEASLAILDAADTVCGKLRGDQEKTS